MLMRILLLTAVGWVPPLAASADPLDCNDMAPVVGEMLVGRMQIPRYLALDPAEAADATLRMNYFHVERQEYKQTFCSTMIMFNPTRFAEAERRAAGMNQARALQALIEAAAVGGLARYANFPAGMKVRYKLELTANGRHWMVTPC
jgi:hypothetical protein